jgi:hypothetical protein
MATKFGTLNTVSTNAGQEQTAGCQRSMMEIKWNSYETSSGVYSSSYISTQKGILTQLQATGNDLVLSLGIHYAPSWVSGLTVGNYTNQAGLVSSAANIIFSADVRAHVNAYLAQVNSDLGLNSFKQIRITSGGNSFGELLYPQEGSGYSYWAFDNAVLTGSGLASGQTTNPFPSWTPGTSTITQAQVLTWATWYVQSLANCAQYLMDELNTLGFTGTYALLMPGSGVRPSSLTLSGSVITGNCPVGNLFGAGPAWQWIATMLSSLSYINRVGFHCSSVGDGSGNDDYTLPSDITTYGSTPTSAAMNNWSASRWITFLSNVYGYLMGGENTGYPGSAAFNAHYSDTSDAGIMNKAVAQAKNGNWLWYDWAHSAHLYDGVQYLANYSNYIRSVDSPASPQTYYHLNNSGVWKRLGE